MKNYTLPQLKDLRTEWIAEGEQKNRFETARLIGKHFAELLPEDQDIAFPRFPRVTDLGGGVRVHYKIIEEYSGALDNTRCDLFEQVCVTVGGLKDREYVSGKRVLFWTSGTTEKYTHLNLFVPGKWERILEGALELAEDKESQEHKEINKAKRDKLKKMLLIGQEV